MKKRDGKTTGIPKRRAYKISMNRIRVTALMFLCLALAALLCMSPLFAIKTILVKGNSHVSTEQILNAADIKRGDNIFAIDSSDIRKRISKLDRIESCSIERSLPGKLSLVIKEKSERAYIKLKSGYAGIDENGRVMIVSQTMEQKAPLISGIKIAEAKKGDYIKSEDKNAKQKTDILITILTSLDELGLVDDVKSVNISNLKKISLTLFTKTVVNLGENGKDSGDKLSYKLSFLKAILDEDYPKNGGIIELSDTSNVTGRVN